MAASRAARVGDHGKYRLLLERRAGAGNESTRSNRAGHGEEDNLVAGSGYYRHQRPADAALAGTLGESLGMTDRSTGGEDSRPQANSTATGRKRLLSSSFELVAQNWREGNLQIRSLRQLGA